MGKTLIIAEKPSVGRDIAAVLPGSFGKGDDVLEGDDYIITWAVGHLVELAEPEDYDAKLKKWRRADLPIVPDEFILRPRSDDARKQLKVIGKQASRNDVDLIVNACDAGREGELIFAYTKQVIDVDKPVKRLWISSMTKKAIREGFEQLRDGTDMRNLEESARARSESDWLVGMNATRAATIKARSAFGGVVSLGRVQTPTLAILAKREKEIQAFEPTTYYTVSASFVPGGEQVRTYDAEWFDPNKTEKQKPTWLMEQAAAEALVAKVNGQAGTIESLVKRKSTERTPLLYDLTTLQREANTRFGFAARRTLAAAQALYERHKVLTYPRTNSRYLTTDMIAELKPRAGQFESRKEYAEAARFVTSLDPLPLDRIVNDEKVDDHHAIIPTEQVANLNDLRPDERRIYDMVVRRFLAVFHPPARYENTTVITVVADERFKVSGKVLVEAGWRAVYGMRVDDPNAGQETTAASAKGKSGKADEKKRLPRLEEGESVETVAAEFREQQTKPPARYSEASLLSAMETAGKLVDDDELADALKERGLGTPATRAQIIELLINRQYIQREGRALRVTTKGMKLIEILEAHPLTSPEMTGEWEKRLRDIEQGELAHDAFLGEIVTFARDTVEKILEIDSEKLRMQRAVIGPCPRCAAEGREELIRENARAFGCTSWKSREEPGCGFVIWRTVAGRQLMPEEAKELLENRETARELQGFRSRAGKPFRAKLRLNDEDKVEFVFKERKGKGASDDDDEDDGEDAGIDAALDTSDEREPAATSS